MDVIKLKFWFIGWGNDRRVKKYLWHKYEDLSLNSRIYTNVGGIIDSFAISVLSQCYRSEMGSGEKRIPRSSSLFYSEEKQQQ